MDWQTIVALGCVAAATWSLGRRAVGLFRWPGMGAVPTGCGSCGQCAGSKAAVPTEGSVPRNFVPLETLGGRAK